MSPGFRSSKLIPGLILRTKSSAACTPRAVISNRGPASRALGDVPVFLGGPVAANQLMFAVFDWDGRDLPSLNQNVDFEEAHQLAEQDHNAVRAFVGYAGWTAGQLENELRQNAWVLQKPSREAFKPERLPKLWFEITRGLGPCVKMRSAPPDDPSLNQRHVTVRPKRFSSFSPSTPTLLLLRITPRITERT